MTTLRIEEHVWEVAIVPDRSTGRLIWRGCVSPAGHKFWQPKPAPPTALSEVPTIAIDAHWFGGPQEASEEAANRWLEAVVQEACEVSDVIRCG